MLAFRVLRSSLHQTARHGDSTLIKHMWPMAVAGTQVHQLCRRQWQSDVPSDGSLHHLRQAQSAADFDACLSSIQTALACAKEGEGPGTRATGNDLHVHCINHLNLARGWVMAALTMLGKLSSRPGAGPKAAARGRQQAEAACLDAAERACSEAKAALTVARRSTRAWTPRNAAQAAEALHLPSFDRLLAALRWWGLRRPPQGSAPSKVLEAASTSVAAARAHGKQLVSAAAWSTLTPPNPDLALHSMPLSRATELLAALSKAGVPGDAVPSSLLQSVCAALGDLAAEYAPVPPSSADDGRSSLQAASLHITRLSLTLPSEAVPRSQVLTWMASTCGAIAQLDRGHHTATQHGDSVEVLVERLPAFLRSSLSERTEALALVAGAAPRAAGRQDRGAANASATAAAAAAVLLGSNPDAPFLPQEVDAVVACFGLAGRQGTNLDALGQVAQAVVHRRRAGFLPHCTAAQLAAASAALAAVYSDVAPPALRHLAHMCVHQLFVRCTADAGESSALSPVEAAELLHVLRPVLRGSPHAFGVDTSFGEAVVRMEASEGWGSDRLHAAMRGRVGPTGQYFPHSYPAEPAQKQLSKMPLASVARVVDAVVGRVIQAIKSDPSSVPVPLALQTLATAHALGEAHASMAASTCGAPRAFEQEGGSRDLGNPAWRPWEGVPEHRAPAWLQEAEQLCDSLQAARKREERGSYRGDLARMLTPVQFWWNGLFPAGLFNVSPRGSSRARPTQASAAAAAFASMPDRTQATVALYSLLLMRALHRVSRDYRRVGSQYFTAASTHELPPTVQSELAASVNVTELGMRRAALAAWAPSSFGYSDDALLRAAAPRRQGAGFVPDVGAAGEEADELPDFSSTSASDLSDGWLHSSSDDGDTVEDLGRFRLAGAPQSMLRAARVNTLAAARLRHFDECSLAHLSWVIADAMFLLRRQAKVNALLGAAASWALVSGTAPPSAQAAAEVLQSNPHIADQAAALLVDASMHSMRASCIALLEAAAAGQVGESKSISGFGELPGRVLGTLRALHCRHSAMAPQAKLREVLLQTYPLPVSAFAAAHGQWGSSPRSDTAQHLKEHAHFLSSFAPLSGKMASVVDATDALASDMYLLAPDVLCGMLLVSGLHEFGLHYRLQRVVPAPASQSSVTDPRQLFPRRVRCASNPTPFKESNLQAQIAAVQTWGTKA